MTESEPTSDGQQSMFSSEDFPAKTSLSLDVVKDWLATDPDCSSSSLVSLRRLLPVGWWSRTSPVCSRPTTDGTWDPSSGLSLNAGMAWRGGAMTLNSEVSRRGAAESSLSDILESPGPHLQKYCLTPKASVGILRRARKRGRGMPKLLEAALLQIAGESETEMPEAA